MATKTSPSLHSSKSVLFISDHHHLRSLTSSFSAIIRQESPGPLIFHLCAISFSWLFSMLSMQYLTISSSVFSCSHSLFLIISFSSMSATQIGGHYWPLAGEHTITILLAVIRSFCYVLSSHVLYLSPRFQRVDAKQTHGFSIPAAAAADTASAESTFTSFFCTETIRGATTNPSTDTRSTLAHLLSLLPLFSLLSLPLPAPLCDPHPLRTHIAR